MPVKTATMAANVNLATATKIILSIKIATLKANVIVKKITLVKNAKFLRIGILEAVKICLVFGRLSLFFLFEKNNAAAYHHFFSKQTATTIYFSKK